MNQCKLDREHSIYALPQTIDMTHAGFQHTLCVIDEKQKTHETDARAHFNQQQQNPLFIETSKFQAIVEIAFEIYGRREFKRKLCCNCTNGQLF